MVLRVQNSEFLYVVSQPAREYERKKKDQGTENEEDGADFFVKDR